MSNLQAEGWEAAARQAEERRDDAIDECNRLRAINAELLAACKLMMERTIGGELTSYQRQRARAAIAKATKEVQS